MPVVSTKDIRRGRYYLDYLSKKNAHNLHTGRISTASGYCVAVNKALRSNFKPDEIDRVITEMQQDCDLNIMALSDFYWLEGDERACYWVWGWLRMATYAELDYIYQPSSIRGTPIQHAQVLPMSTPSLYDHLNLNKNPSSTKERFNAIVVFFDLWHKDLWSRQCKLQELNKYWSDIDRVSKPFRWLDPDNEDQCRWAWEYMDKAGVHLFGIHPSNTSERYLAIYARYDLWVVSLETKKLFVLGIDKAWSQKKHRDGMVDKKSLNTYLKKEVKGRLDELAEHYDKKIHQMLEVVINEAYDRLKK